MQVFSPYHMLLRRKNAKSAGEGGGGRGAGGWVGGGGGWLRGCVYMCEWECVSE